MSAGDRRVINIGPCECCGPTGTGTPGPDDCQGRGQCTLRWDGVFWEVISNDCSPDGTPVIGEPGCTWSSCVCGLIPLPGDFIGEIRVECCTCAKICV